MLVIINVILKNNYFECKIIGHCWIVNRSDRKYGTKLLSTNRIIKKKKKTSHTL